MATSKNGKLYVNEEDDEFRWSKGSKEMKEIDDFLNNTLRKKFENFILIASNDYTNAHECGNGEMLQTIMRYECDKKSNKAKRAREKFGDAMDDDMYDDACLAEMIYDFVLSRAHGDEKECLHQFEAMLATAEMQNTDEDDDERRSASKGMVRTFLARARRRLNREYSPEEALALAIAFDEFTKKFKDSDVHKEFEEGDKTPADIAKVLKKFTCNGAKFDKEDD